MRGSALAFDHGTRRTGIAVTDPLHLSVEPLETVEGSGEVLLERIAKLLEERDVEAFIVGQPLNMDGSSGPRAADVDRFCAALTRRFPGVSIVRIDERLTTKEAEARLTAAGYRGKERKQRKDAWSAALLLEDWIRSGAPLNPSERG